MVRNRTIQIRLTKDEYERIKNNADARGFKSLSGFLRNKALDYDFIMHQKIHEIYVHLMPDTITTKNRKKVKSMPISEFIPK